MVTSMTGYGRAQEIIEGRDITVEIKSVNHRFFEFSARVPRAYGYLEEKLKNFINAKISRGKVDLYVQIINLEGTNAAVEINTELAASYLKALRSTAQRLGLTDNVQITDLSRFSDIFAVRKTEEDEDKIWESVLAVALKSVEKFMEMRQNEGENLKKDVCSRLDALENLIKIVEEKSPETVSAYREKLSEKMRQVLENEQVEEQRILLEAAVFAEKTAVDEETVRLKSHIAQFRSFLTQSEPMGRKLDFLVQELNRESNTIGSKCQNLEISHIVVDIKSEIEKIREQIQNIE